MHLLFKIFSKKGYAPANMAVFTAESSWRPSKEACASFMGFSRKREYENPKVCLAKEFRQIWSLLLPKFGNAENHTTSCTFNFWTQWLPNFSYDSYDLFSKKKTITAFEAFKFAYRLIDQHPAAVSTCQLRVTDTSNTEHDPGRRTTKHTIPVPVLMCSACPLAIAYSADRILTLQPSGHTNLSTLHAGLHANLPSRHACHPPCPLPTGPSSQQSHHHHPRSPGRTHHYRASLSLRRYKPTPTNHKPPQRTNRDEPFSTSNLHKGSPS